jgi:hypothetical protein
MKHRIHAGSIRLLMTALALLVLFLGNSTVNAQVLYGSLTGTVTDKTGAVVPNVAVTATNQGTNEIRSAQTNGRGEYALRDVLPGVYTVSVSRSASFSGFTQKGIVIEVNHEIRVDVTLQLAGVTTDVIVDTAPPELQTETAEVSHEISESELIQLPVAGSQGRNFQNLYTIIPGAANVIEQNSTASNPSRAMSVNVNGVEDMSNTTRIDGAMNFYGWLPYIVAYVPPADSIENVNITTNSFNAEQGLAGGAAIAISIKSGTKNFHGSAWEYYQDAAFNARAYTATQASLISPANPSGSVPKNVFDEFGFNVGGPIYIPKILTGKQKLFFFQNFERTTRRQLIGNNVSVPDLKMLGGDFSEVASIAPLYDPQPTVGTYPASSYINGYLVASARPTFQSEYGCNCIPAARFKATEAAIGQKMVSLLTPIATAIGTPTPAAISGGLVNDYYGTGTLAYNRNTSDTKITYIPNDNTQIFGRYSIEPFTVSDPQELGAAGGGTFDGGQPGAAAGRIQNVGMGASHTLSASMVLDADFGYTRQVTGAQSAIDIADGDFGSNTLGIPGTNGSGSNYVGQPIFQMGGGSGNFNTLGNANGANPFKFRDNQFTGDVNLSWTKGKHATKYGATYYHFLLNHFQPTSGSGINNPRGGFAFSGGMTCGGTSCGVTNYNNLADLLLGLPNNGTGTAVTKATQLTNPNSLRWSEYAAYAQDQWTMTPKFTLNYGVRYEFYPAPYRDKTGVYILDPNLPQTANVEVGGVGGNPENAGLDMGHGFFAPRLGIAYRFNAKTVIRSGGGITSDPDSLRFLRDSFPEDLTPSYGGTQSSSITVDSGNKSAAYPNGAPMTLAYGIPAAVPPTVVNGFVSLPVSGGTTTAAKNFHRGYIESWNLFIERELSHQFVANVGYVGTHQVRQLVSTGYLNAASLPSANTPCMANGQWNPSTGLTGSCNFNANEIINQQWCGGTSNLTCYNTGGIGMVMPLFSSYYSGLQSQLTYNGGASKQLGVVYTFSHAVDFEDNGAGSGSAGTTFNYPGYYAFNRAVAGYDRPHNLQIWGMYSLPFGRNQMWANSGLASAILGGFQLNGQLSHTSGAPFSVTANGGTTINTPGQGSLYATLVKPYHQLSGHNRTAGNTAISDGKPWFDPSSFANPVEPSTCVVYDAKSCPTPNGTGTSSSPIISPQFGNTTRNQFRGPGQTALNASIFRSIHMYRESNFQIRFEAFNILNHALLASPNNVTVPTNANIQTGTYGSFGMITSGYGGSRSLQISGRFNF